MQDEIDSTARAGSCDDAVHVLRRIFPIMASTAALLLVLLVLPGCGGASVAQPPVRVTVDGDGHLVDPGTTFGSLIRDLHLHAVTGRSLSVHGAVLDADADPGRILLNGHAAREDTIVASGDAIRIVDGADEFEGTRRIVRDLGRRVGNPERTLAIYPTQEITVRGRISNEFASVTERSIGKGRAPRDVALTFDDGPWPRDTDRILDVLASFHVHATFFMVGSDVLQRPGVVRRVLAGGNEIGNHSFDHPLTFEKLGPRAVRSEIAKTEDALAALHVTPTLFRPPGGWYNDELVQAARRQGERVVLWGVDPQDWRSSLTADQVRESVLSHVRAGSIVLLHDGGGDAAHTIAALPGIIRGIRQRGLRLVTIPAHPV